MKSIYTQDLFLSASFYRDTNFFTKHEEAGEDYKLMRQSTTTGLFLRNNGLDCSKEEFRITAGRILQLQKSAKILTTTPPSVSCITILSVVNKYMIQ